MSHPLKSWAPIDEQICRLRRRGMEIEDRESEFWLRAVGYYRLSGYWHPYRSEASTPNENGHKFVEGTTFHDVVELYEFDRKLRELSLSAIARIEFGLRSRLSYELGRDDPEGHLDERNFTDGQAYDAMRSIVNKRIERAISSNDPIAVHHEEKYGGRYPIWVVTEFFDFSDVSRLYAAIVPEKRDAIADYFQFSPSTDGFNSGVRAKLVSWLHNLAIVRNTAAHHARLWNRPFKPTSGKGVNWLPGMGSIPKSNHRIFGSLSVMAYLLRTVSPGSSWTGKVRGLMTSEFSKIYLRNLAEMQFPANWLETSIFADS